MKKKCILITLVSLLLISVLLLVYFAAFYIPPALRAHIAENTTPLETENLFDAPDFILYTKGDTTVRLSPELQAEVVAELERLLLDVNGVRFTRDNYGVSVKDHINSIKDVGAIRFCYVQRRKFVGKLFGYSGGKDRIGKADRYDYTTIGFSEYFWEDLQYDEIIFRRSEIFFGFDGEYCNPISYQILHGSYEVWNDKITYSENTTLVDDEDLNLMFCNDNKQSILFKSMVDIAEAGLAE